MALFLILSVCALTLIFGTIGVIYHVVNSDI